MAISRVLPALRRACLSCAGVALLSLSACPFGGLCPSDEPWATNAIATSTTNDLHAIAALSDYDAESGTSWDYLAVGGTGTIVVIGTTFDESSAGSFVESQQLGAVALRAALEIDNAWWIVGDQGLAAYSIDRAATWTSVVLNSVANLHDLARFDGAVVLVGDEAVFVRQANGVWAELPPPADEGGADGDDPASWGALRSVFAHEDRLYAAGLGGVLWSTSEVTTGWAREAIDTEADLFALGSTGPDGEGALRVVGSGGAMFEREAGGSWAALDSGTSLDLIDLADGIVLTREGGVLAPGLDDAEPVELVPALEGARALSYDSALVLAGQDGAVQRSTYYDCAN